METSKNTDTFGLFQNERQNEHNDCAVRAVATLTCMNYQKVHEVFESNGRKNRKGTSTSIVLASAKRLMPNFKNAKDNDAWKRAMKVAQDEIEGKSKLKLIATHYCRIDAFCPWMDSMQAKGTIGDHRFAYDPKWKSRATPVLVASGT
jgi:hypothetical protein